MKKRLLPGLAFLILMQMALANLHAIPAFARKYRMSCKTCHAPFPKLKAYGDEFAQNGFVIKDKDAPRYVVDTGDDFLSLIRELPIALRLEGFWTYNNSNKGQIDFTSPYLLKILSGGEITKNISYYFYFFFSERGEVAGIEDAFVMFNNLFGTELDFYVGQFQVSDPLFKREIRLTFEDYMVYKASPGSSQADLTYDRGIIAAYGLPSGTDLVVEVVNGSGLNPANPFRNYDEDKYKNILLRVSQDVAEPLRVGGFYYFGKEEQVSEINSMWLAGADATVSSRNLELNLQYVERRDRNPYFLNSASDDIKTRGAFAEIIYSPRGDDSKWYGVGLWNWVTSDQKELEYGSLTMHLGFLLRRNFRLTSEFSYIYESAYAKHARLAVGLITAF
ncbi:MAG: hypothetical protein MUP98_10840 [Candidatus Aminicenantes bacterium]|nr:hypothetical protein [Candidatus Aminicenantes bacterium]